MHELQRLGIRIAGCNPSVWDDLQLDDTTRTAMQEYARLSREARRRQAQYIGRLLRDYDLARINSYFASREQARRYRDACAAKLPDWYRALIAGALTPSQLAQSLPEVAQKQLEDALLELKLKENQEVNHLPVPPTSAPQLRLWQLLLDALPPAD